jgi:5-hydroxyisourate hydrolase
MHNSNRPVISTHVLDLSRGEPAAGVPVTLSRVDGGKVVPLITLLTDTGGRIAALGEGELHAGTYQVAFDVAAYFRKRGDSVPAFFSRVTLDLDVTDPARAYHVPLLVTPYSCASYRGS